MVASSGTIAISIAISLFDQPPPAPDGVRAEVVATTAEEFTSQSLRHLMTELVGLVVAGTLQVVVSQTYTLGQAALAQEGRKRGKVVIGL